MESFVVLPFATGCASQSSVSVAATSEPKKPRSETTRQLPVTTRGGDESTSKERMKNPFIRLKAFPKPNISRWIQKLIKSIKSLRRLFETEEEVEKEMEIGYPTDVKHVTHIGLDGKTTTNPTKGWEELKASEIISFPSISLRQFELAMAAQAHSETAVAPPASKPLLS